MTDGSKPTVDRKPRTRTIVNARRAIADFVESNAPRMNDWLERVAEGIPKRDADGRKLIDTQGSVVYVVKPDPATAVKLVVSYASTTCPSYPAARLQSWPRSRISTTQTYAL